jgi:23S rRNA pseudouridine2605 synthase
VNVDESKKIRLQKLLADRGIAARRGAEILIRDGRVTVNGQIVTVLGSKVDPDHDLVELDGRPLPEQRPHRVIMLHKPVGYVSTCRVSREQGSSVLELIPADRRYFPVGRLDRDSSGMLLLTDDGEFSQRLMHPRHEIEKVYIVKASRALTRDELSSLRTGVLIDGRMAAPRSIKSERPGQYRIVLAEGRKRQIRRMFQALGIAVVSLCRVQIGGLALSDLPVGAWKILNQREIQQLLQPSNRIPV